MYAGSAGQAAAVPGKAGFFLSSHSALHPGGVAGSSQRGSWRENKQVVSVSLGFQILRKAQPERKVSF